MAEMVSYIEYQIRAYTDFSRMLSRPQGYHHLVCTIIAYLKWHTLIKMEASALFVWSRLKPINLIKTKSTDTLLQYKMSSLDNHEVV